MDAIFDPSKIDVILLANPFSIPERIMREMQEGGQNYAATTVSEKPGPYIDLRDYQ